MRRPPSPTASPTMNGTRHPYAITAAGGRITFTIAPAAEPSSVPAKAPNGLQLPIHPRLPGGECAVRGEQRGGRVAGREKVRADLLREEAEQREVVPLEHVADHAGYHAAADCVWCPEDR